MSDKKIGSAVALLLIIAAIVFALLIFSGKAAIVNDNAPEGPGTELPVDPEVPAEPEVPAGFEPVTLYQDDYVLIEYLGDNEYRFTALQPANLDYWHLWGDDMMPDKQTDEVSWTYTFTDADRPFFTPYSEEDGFNYFYIYYCGIDGPGLTYMINVTDITADICPT